MSQNAGVLLREWRQRRSLSQLELASRAGVSTRHVSFVETGRSRPTPAMILRLCDELAVPLREQNRVLHAGGFAPAHPEHRLSEPPMAEISEAIEAILASHLPYPALVIDPGWDLVSANDAIYSILGNVAPRLLEPPVNVIRLSLDPEGLAPMIRNLDEWREHLMARLRHEYDASRDQRIADLLAEYSTGRASPSGHRVSWCRCGSWPATTSSGCGRRRRSSAPPARSPSRSWRSRRSTPPTRRPGSRCKPRYALAFGSWRLQVGIQTPPVSPRCSATGTASPGASRPRPTPRRRLLARPLRRRPRRRRRCPPASTAASSSTPSSSTVRTPTASSSPRSAAWPVRRRLRRWTYGQGYPGAPGDSGGGTGKRIGLIALAVLLIAGLAVGGFFLVRTLTDDDGDSTADDSSQTEGTNDPESPTQESPTESPTDESPTEESPTETTPAGDPCTGGAPGAGGSTSANGRIRGGGLELPPVRGFDPVESQIVSMFTFADEVAAVGRQVEEGWIAFYSVGGCRRPNARPTSPVGRPGDHLHVRVAELLRNFTERKDLERESIQVDGHDAYSVTTELRIDDPEVQVDGDVAKVIVVDTGDDDSFGLYVSVVPIGDQKLINQQDAATRQLKVDD